MKKIIILITLLLILSFCLFLCGCKSEGEEKATPAQEYFDKNIMPYLSVALSSLGGSLIALISLVNAVKKVIEKLNLKKSEYEKEREEANKLIAEMEKMTETLNRSVLALDKTSAENKKILESTAKLRKSMRLVYANNPSLVSTGVAKEVVDLLDEGGGEGEKQG